MRRRVLALALASAATAGFLALRSGSSPSPSPAAPSAAATNPLAGARTVRGLVPRAHYQLRYDQDVTAPGKPAIHIHIAGEWTATPRADGRTEVRFVPAVLDGPPAELPQTDDLGGAAQLVTERGVLSAIGFPDYMPPRARKLVTGLATALQYTAGAGDDWTATEEDLTGRYDAAYRRAGDQIERSRARYTALRTASGLSVAAAGNATTTETTQFRVDAAGIVTAAVALDVAFALPGGGAPLHLVLRASLERTSIDHVAALDDAALPAAPISGHVDFDSARRNADRGLVAGAGLADLLAEAHRVAGLTDTAGGNARAQAMARLAALIRLEPDTAEDIAQAVREHPEALAESRLLLGALASSRIAAGTDALAGLMADPLPDAARSAVVGALSFANPATPAGLQALAAGLDQPHGDQAALGLGALSRKARERDPAGADSAVAQLLERQSAASGDHQRRLYIEALGNSGAAQALPALRAAMASSDRQLASAAAYSLRFVPGPDVDALLEQSIARPDVALAAIRAAAYRDPAHWRPLLAAAQQQYAGHDGIQAEIRAILRRWD